MKDFERANQRMHIRIGYDQRGRAIELRWDDEVSDVLPVVRPGPRDALEKLDALARDRSRNECLSDFVGRYSWHHSQRLCASHGAVPRVRRPDGAARCDGRSDRRLHRRWLPRRLP